MLSDTIRRKQFLFDRWAPSYDWLLPSVFYQAVHQRLLDTIALPGTAHVLDLGCGTGKLLDRLARAYPQLEGTGIDLSREMLRQANQRNRYADRLHFVQANVESLPFDDAAFDAAFSTLSFLHYPQPERVLAEIHRVLVPGGRFCWADWIASGSEARSIVLPSNIRFYSRAARAQLGTAARLQCQGHHDLLGWVVLTVLSKPE